MRISKLFIIMSLLVLIGMIATTAFASNSENYEDPYCERYSPKPCSVESGNNPDIASNSENYEDPYCERYSPKPCSVEFDAAAVVGMLVKIFDFSIDPYCDRMVPQSCAIE